MKSEILLDAARAVQSDSAVTPFPADAVEVYRADGTWGHRTVAQELRAVAAQFPDREAVVGPEGRLTFAALDERADRLAAGLAELGLRPGEPVVLQVLNTATTIVLWYALVKAGLVPVCTLAAHRRHEIDAISRKVGAAAHVVDAQGGGSFDLVQFAREVRSGHPTVRHVLTLNADHRGQEEGEHRLENLGEHVGPVAARTLVDEIQAGIDPDAVAVLQLSGGTTGIPKVIPRLHAEYWSNARSYAERLEWDESTRTYCPGPVVHNAGTVCTLHAAHAVGGCTVLGGADPEQILTLLEDERVTDLLVGQFMFATVTTPRFLESGRFLKRAVLSGGKIPDDVFERIEDMGVWPGQLFGMGEGPFALTPLSSPRDARRLTVGIPLSPHDDFRVFEPGTEMDVEPGEVGELVCRGPFTLRGYYDAPDINAEAFTSEGYFRTGDLVKLQSISGQTYFSLEGRTKDLINRGGEKISASEVEGMLVAHPGIEEVAVVAMPDERLGERSCAYLVPVSEPVPLDQIQNFLESHGLAKFKWPERLEWLDRLPRTKVGKFDKKAMREDVAGKVASEAGSSR